MTKSNPLKDLVCALENRWYPSLELALKIGYTLKLHDIDWRSKEELATYLDILVELKFIQLSTDGRESRINQAYFT